MQSFPEFIIGYHYLKFYENFLCSNFVLAQIRPSYDFTSLKSNLAPDLGAVFHLEFGTPKKKLVRYNRYEKTKVIKICKNGPSWSKKKGKISSSQKHTFCKYFKKGQKFAILLQIGMYFQRNKTRKFFYIEWSRAISVK